MVLGKPQEVIAPKNYETHTLFKKTNTLEAIAGTFYNLLENGIPTSHIPNWFRPSFNVYTKSARLRLAQPLEALDNWEVTEWDKQRAITLDKAIPTHIDWKERFAKLFNSPFLLPINKVLSTALLDYHRHYPVRG